GAAVRDAPFDAFRDELGRRHLALLEVAVGRALLHGAEAAHPADHLEAPPLEQERLARALLGACLHRTPRHALGPRGDPLAPVSVATFPPTSCASGNASRRQATVLSTPSECPCAESTTMTSQPASTSARARPSASGVPPTAAATRRRPC